MKTDMEQALVRAKIRRWRDVRSGWLVIESGQLVVYRNKLIGGLQKVVDFEVDRLISLEQDPAGNSLRLVFKNPEGEPSDEVFSLPVGKQAEAVNTTLTELLKKVEEQKKRVEDEAVRVERERQEHLKQVRETFANEVWETSESLWLISKADYSMVCAVITANWNEARQQYSTIWQQADRLKKTCRIDLTLALKELDEVMSSQNGREIIKKSSHFLKQLFCQILQPEIIWGKWQDQKGMLASVLPNCNHLSYFLLFSAGYFEALLAAQIEDWTGVNNVFPLLRSSSTIFQNCFGFNLDGDIDTVNSAATDRNIDLFTETARRIESAVLSSFKSRPFKFEPPVEQIKG